MYAIFYTYIKILNTKLYLFKPGSICSTEYTIVDCHEIRTLAWIFACLEQVDFLSMSFEWNGPLQFQALICSTLHTLVKFGH